LLDRFGKDAWRWPAATTACPGQGRIKRPKAVIDLNGLAELKGIRETPDGVEIGALETLTNIERDPVIKAKYRVLADAASKVAAPQIRNQGTLAAMRRKMRVASTIAMACLLQGRRNACYADTPEASTASMHCSTSTVA